MAPHDQYSGQNQATETTEQSSSHIQKGYYRIRFFPERRESSGSIQSLVISVQNWDGVPGRRDGPDFWVQAPRRARRQAGRPSPDSQLTVGSRSPGLPFLNSEN